METNPQAASATAGGDLAPDKKAAIYTDEYFDECYKEHWFAYNKRTLEERDAQFFRLLELKPTDILLEAGCSTGRSTRVLAPKVKQVYGIDFAEYAVELANKKAQDAGLSNVEVRHDDISKMATIADASIDKIAAFDITEHVYDDVMKGFFQQAERVLKPGGYCCIYTPNLNHYIERMKSKNFIIRQFESHIAVRNWKQYKRLLDDSGAKLRVDLIYHTSSSYPLVRWFEKVLRFIPWFGKLFEFRICARLVKDA
ncbi:MAG: class I SAM-dependent methyltransferase [Planctomycetes bacterium]|nr:class I SAM-dependent methyltransferase [Planctomycetota bacterium]